MALDAASICSRERTLRHSSPCAILRMTNSMAIFRPADDRCDALRMDLEAQICKSAPTILHAFRQERAMTLGAESGHGCACRDMLGSQGQPFGALDHL
jgi:hypothetical protein